MKGFKRSLTVVITSVLVASGLSSQTPASAGQATEASGETMAGLRVFALGPSGDVAGLSKEDFRLYDGEAEQSVSYFADNKALRREVVILIDANGAKRMRQSSGSIPDITDFLRQVLRKQDKGTVADYDSRVRMIASGSDPGKLETAFRQGMQAKSNSLPALYDAVFASARDIFQIPNSLRVLIVVTSGEDHGSHVTAEAAAQTAVSHSVSVFTILLGGAAGGDDQASSAPGSAALLSSRSGGISSPISTDKEFETALGRIAQAVENSFTVGFYPQGTAHDGMFHNLRVQCRRQGLQTLAPTGYFAPSK